MTSKTALITGFSGQDAPFLSQLLLSKGYKVYGMVRRASNHNFDFVKEMGLGDVEIVQGDLCDNSSLYHIIDKIRPTEIYNLAAQSHVGTSFQQPEHTGDVTGLGVLRILENIRLHSPLTKLYQAGSSEQWGSTPPPHNESSPFMPNSPYAAAKVYAHNLCRIYRESYNIFTCVGLLNNHESERRSKDFLTRKVTSWMANYCLLRSDEIYGGLYEPLRLGNLYAKRDIGYAKDYVEAMYLMLQQEKARDYVIGTGNSYTMKEFINMVMDYCNIKYRWYGEGLDEKCYNDATGLPIIVIDPKFYRPLEVNHLQADYNMAKCILNWRPTTSIGDLVRIMVEYDLDKAKLHVNTSN